MILQYEIRMCQKIHNKVTMTMSSYFNFLLILPISRKAIFQHFHEYLWIGLSHPNLSATLAADQKLPLTCLCISYQILAECHLP
jgi:hypothetical protein